jgi:hypothetical protein
MVIRWQYDVRHIGRGRDHFTNDGSNGVSAMGARGQRAARGTSPSLGRGEPLVGDITQLPTQMAGRTWPPSLTCTPGPFEQPWSASCPCTVSTGSSGGCATSPGCATKLASVQGSLTTFASATIGGATLPKLLSRYERLIGRR